MTMEKERQEFTSWQFDRIIQLEQELTELRAWKEQRLKEDTKSYFKSLEENGQLGALIDNLNKLRAWKAKARPYIEERLEFLQNCLEEASGPIDEGFEVELKELEELSELTELLGGSDE